MTLGKLLKTEGRSQQWLEVRLRENGVDRETTTINHWCTGKRTPPDDYILIVIANILSIDKGRVFDCFGKNDEEEMTF